jgi:UDP-N-acetylmuramyl tripeptide synthase
MDVLATAVGKLIVLALSLAGRRATALPGLVVEKLFPRYLPRVLSTLRLGVIVVTGTNGKTTTTKMVATVLARRHRVLTNDTGGNFVRGCLTAALNHSSWSGRVEADVAVFELDEAHAVRFCRVYPPERLVLLNVLRDQLDRFGEIDTTAQILGRVAAATTGHVVLNRDDPRLVALAPGLTAQVSYFGVAPALRPLFPTDEELYSGQVTVHETLASAELTGLELGATTEITLRIDGRDGAQPVTARLSLRAEGAHNAQNAAAAAAIALTTGMSGEDIIEGLRSVQPAFGRGQSFDLDGRRVVLQLVKNPAGFRQSLMTVAALEPVVTVIGINDDYADGRDMSWLWDVPFTQPLSRGGLLIAAGTRATDMALRLHYDELPVHLVQADLAESVEAAVRRAEAGQTVVVFCTYTAMWELHRVLERRTGTAVR